MKSNHLLPRVGKNTRPQLFTSANLCLSWAKEVSAGTERGKELEAGESWGSQGGGKKAQGKIVRVWFTNPPCDKTVDVRNSATERTERGEQQGAQMENGATAKWEKQGKWETARRRWTEDGLKRRWGTDSSRCDLIFNAPNVFRIKAACDCLFCPVHVAEMISGSSHRKWCVVCIRQIKMRITPACGPYQTGVVRRTVKHGKQGKQQKNRTICADAGDLFIPCTLLFEVAKVLASRCFPKVWQNPDETLVDAFIFKRLDATLTTVTNVLWYNSLAVHLQGGNDVIRTWRQPWGWCTGVMGTGRGDRMHSGREYNTVLCPSDKLAAPALSTGVQRLSFCL